MLTHAIRTLLMYLVAIFALRLMGKRQLGELQPSEFVVTLLISELAVVPMQDMEIPALSGIVPIIILISVELFLSFFSMKSARLRTLLSGKPIPVIHRGQIDQRQLRALRQTSEDLLEELRLKDVFDLNQVIFAQVETNGKLSVLTQAEDPASSDPKGYAIVLISDGKLEKDGLRQSGRTMEWLKSVLIQQEIKSIEEVFLLTVDEYDHVILQREELL